MGRRETPSFVQSVLETEVTVVTGDPVVADRVKALGGRRRLVQRGVWRMRYRSRSELASLLASLRDAQVAMADAPGGWPPAAVFERLRQQGELNGNFLSATFYEHGVKLTER